MKQLKQNAVPNAKKPNQSRNFTNVQTAETDIEMLVKLVI